MSAARAVVEHDLDHIAETAERILADGRGRSPELAHAVSDAADALAYVTNLAPSLGPVELGTLTRTARALGTILTTIDPERITA